MRKLCISQRNHVRMSTVTEGLMETAQIRDLYMCQWHYTIIHQDRSSNNVIGR